MMHEQKDGCTLQQASGATKERLLDKLVMRQQKKQEELLAKAGVAEGEICPLSSTFCGHKSLGLCCTLGLWSCTQLEVLREDWNGLSTPLL